MRKCVPQVWKKKLNHRHPATPKNPQLRRLRSQQYHKRGRHPSRTWSRRPKRRRRSTPRNGLVPSSWFRRNPNVSSFWTVTHLSFVFFRCDHGSCSCWKMPPECAAAFFNFAVVSEQWSSREEESTDAETSKVFYWFFRTFWGSLRSAGNKNIQRRDKIEFWGELRINKLGVLQD